MLTMVIAMVTQTWFHNTNAAELPKDKIERFPIKTKLCTWISTHSMK
jgi:hypothetical protein